MMNRLLSIFTKHPTVLALILPFTILQVIEAAQRTVAPLSAVEDFSDVDSPGSYWDGSYRWFYPWGYEHPDNASRIYPLVVFGPWNEGEGYFTDDIRKRYPAFYLSFDQASDEAGAMLSESIDVRMKDQYFRIDLNRIYLTGFSMGGSGSYKTLRGFLKKGKCFAGIIRIAGQSESVLCEEAIEKVAISMHIGLDDTQQRIEVSRALYAYIRDHASNVSAIETVVDEPNFQRKTWVLTMEGAEVIRYSEYTGMGHCTNLPYSDPSIFEWLMTRQIRN